MSSQWREEEAREGDGLEGEEEEDGQQFKDREHLVFLIDAGPEMCADKIVTTTGMPPQSSLSIVVLTAADFMRKRIASGYSKDEFAVIFYNTRETDNPSLHKHVHVFTPRAQPKAAAIQALQRLVTEAEFDTRVGSWAPAVGDMDGAREAADTLKNALWTVMDSLQGGGSIKAAQHRIFMFSNTEDPLAGLPAGQDREEYWRKVLYRAEALHNMRATLRFFPIAAAVHPFAMATFWDALMAPLRDPDDDYTPTPLPAAPAGVPSTLSLGAEAVIERLGRLGEYMQRCLQRRRVSATLKWCLGEGLELSCQVFDLFVTATTPWSVKLRAQDNALLMRVTSRVNEATGALVERVEHKMLVPKGKSQGRFPMVVFKKSELAAITHCLPVGLRLLGFRPRADLLDYHNMTHSSFLRPTERLVQGSTALFRALLDSMARKRVLALCSYVRTPVSHPCLVALLPQREEVDDAGYQVWAEGMHMVRLPFKDDVRSPETDPTQVGPQPLVSADEAAVDAAAAVVAALRYQDLSLGEVPNPALERHFRILEAIALGDDAEPEPAADGTLPPDDINILAGPLLDALRAATGLDVQEAPGAKRKAPAADLPTSEAYALQDWAKLARDGKLEKLSNDTLKVYLKFHRLKLTGKKAELLDRIRTHMGTSAEPRPPSRNLHAPRRTECAPLPVYVALESDVLSPQHTIAYEEALRVGLKAVRLLGVVGIAVDVAWSVVEAAGPQRYCWAGYRRLFDLIAGMGFKLQVSLCFHATEAAGLPPWVQAAAANNPDLYFADRAAARATECLTCGVDEVPALGGRTAVQVYSDLMASFKQEFEPLLADGTISTIVVGLGPRGELRYPSHPPTSAAAPSASTPASQRLWEYPGVGEFQCYDRYLLSSLKACAEQVRQPPWGLGGPHDAGSYTTWPHQSAFFAGAAGSWTSAYGRFFLQWYAEVLAAHGGRVMAAAASTFDGVTPPLGLQARLPAPYWWFNTPSHGAELTAGYYNTAQREGYLLPLSTLASAGAAGVQLGMAEARNIEHPSAHCVDPERLLLQQRAVAAALHMPVTLQNSEPRFDEPALARMHAALFEPATHLGIELPPPRALVFNYMSDAMFEPANWQRFKAFVRQVHARAGDLVGATAPAANRATARG